MNAWYRNTNLQMIFALLLISLVKICMTVEADLTVDVDPGTQECFYQQAKRDTTLEVEYQVLDGGDLDIDFILQSPDGRIMVADNRKSDGVHKVEVKLPGDYKICLDNTFSHFSRKLVFFEIITDDDEEDDKDDWEDVKDDISELIDVTLEDFKKIIDSVKANLDRSNSLQGALRNYELRDRSIQESNFERVNWMSGIQLFVMVSVGLTQVLMIRYLFEDKSKIGQLIRART